MPCEVGFHDELVAVVPDDAGVGGLDEGIEWGAANVLERRFRLARYSGRSRRGPYF